MDPEPLPQRHPLWKFENVIITPHIAGRSDHDRERMVHTVRENIQRFVEGKPLLTQVRHESAKGAAKLLESVQATPESALHLRLSSKCSGRLRSSWRRNSFCRPMVR